MSGIGNAIACNTAKGAFVWNAVILPISNLLILIVDFPTLFSAPVLLFGGAQGRTRPIRKTG
jgi:hypothetical protein